jgi:hypothetical protein
MRGLSRVFARCCALLPIVTIVIEPAHGKKADRQAMSN